LRLAGASSWDPALEVVEWMRCGAGDVALR
jgi:hypothetical protein